MTLEDVTSALEVGLEEVSLPPGWEFEPPAIDADGPPGDPERPNGFDLSDDQMALDLGRASWDRDARFVAAWSAWFFWAEVHWSRDTCLGAMTRSREFLRTMAKRVISAAERLAVAAEQKGDTRGAEKIRAWAKAEGRALRDRRKVAAVEGLARSNVASAVPPTAFDSDGMLLGTPRGVVDLRTGRLRGARREDLISKLCAVGPEEGQPVEWLKFLDTIFDGNRLVIAFLRRAMGYSLTGDTREHKLFFAHGTGANGKSTFLNIMFFIAGDYGRRAAATTFLNKTAESHPTDLAGLQGARVVVASELRKGATWDESVIKDLTGGDVMTARYMRGDFFDFKPEAKLWIAGNTLPSFRGVDEAMRRRMVLLPFAVTIPPEDRDPALPAKLEAEAGKILAWMIQGALEWQRIGLKVPDEIADASGDYLDDEDVLGQFIADEVTKDFAGFETTSDVHLRFRTWSERQGLNPWTLRTLQKELVSRGFSSARRKNGNGFNGMRLRR